MIFEGAVTFFIEVMLLQKLCPDGYHQMPQRRLESPGGAKSSDEQCLYCRRLCAKKPDPKIRRNAAPRRKQCPAPEPYSPTPREPQIGGKSLIAVDKRRYES
ncbi:unnamed protein product [Cuscuta europaea]|uniref:Uncharacterized protein n=1 Tax=Cuscuta europaea TaxID=41803 RepID=A0A9P0YUS5_CUSEU|nr:unnamed protein product [Cuscuta europaea]